MGVDSFSPRTFAAPFPRRSGIDVRYLASDLEKAIAHGALHLVFQPKICVRSGNHVGAEALIRWSHPVHGPIAPDDFIPMAETTGLIGAIGEWVMDQCCCLIATATSNGLPAPRLAVNLSPLELQDDSLCGRLRALTRLRKVDPCLIELEITENAFIDDPKRASDALGHLRALGARIAIDDFGTGYSSLAYLKSLPIDVLKLDRAFVADIDQCTITRRLVRTVAALGHTLGMAVVAEGVERESQAEMLARCNIDIAQGYHYARPMSGGDFLAWMSDGRVAYDRHRCRQCHPA